MNTKLTLTIQEEVIKTAKEFAKEKGQSLSEMVENYFKLLTHHRKEETPVKLSPKIQKLKGILKMEEESDYKKILQEELSKKYGV